MEQIKVLLNENDIPRQWYNLAADLPTSPASSCNQGWYRENHREASAGGSCGCGCGSESAPWSRLMRSLAHRGVATSGRAKLRATTPAATSR